MTRIFKLWLGSLLLVALLALISVRWVDRPVATWVHDIFGSPHFGRTVSSPGLSIPLLSAILFVIYGFAAILGRCFSKPETAALMCTVSLLATEVIKSQLKFVFGRTWPDSWAPGVLSFIHDNQFGFHFFHGGRSFGSFPSGHAASVAAVMSVLWIMFPRLRSACVICMAAADVALVLWNLHFISDVVVGTFVGISVGLFTVALWSAAGRPVSPRFSLAKIDNVSSIAIASACERAAVPSSFRQGRSVVDQSSGTATIMRTNPTKTMMPPSPIPKRASALGSAADPSSGK
jgi:membrane-associated phospholipid phosphatase